MLSPLEHEMAESSFRVRMEWRLWFLVEKKNTVITTWRENEGDDPTESWKQETEFETKMLLSAHVIRMFPFLFAKDGRAKASPMDDTAVLKGM